MAVPDLPSQGAEVIIPHCHIHLTLKPQGARRQLQGPFCPSLVIRGVWPLTCVCPPSRVPELRGCIQFSEAPLFLSCHSKMSAVPISPAVHTHCGQCWLCSEA